MGKMTLMRCATLLLSIVFSYAGEQSFCFRTPPLWYSLLVYRSEHTGRERATGSCDFRQSFEDIEQSNEPSSREKSSTSAEIFEEETVESGSLFGRVVSLAKLLTVSILSWPIRVLLFFVLLSLPLLAASMPPGALIAATQADLLVLWAWTLSEFVPTVVVILFAMLVLSKSIPWRFLLIVFDESILSTWERDMSERTVLLMLLASVVAQAVLPLVLVVLPRAVFGAVVSVALLAGIVLPNMLRLNRHRNRTEVPERAPGLSRRRAAGLLVFTAWQVLRFCRLLPPVEGQFTLLILLVAGNLLADGELGQQIDERIQVIFSPLMAKLTSVATSYGETIFLILSVISGLFAVSATVLFPKWSLLTLLPVRPSRTAQLGACGYALLIIMDMTSLSVHHRTIVRPVLLLAALVAEIAMPVLLVASTWISLPSSRHPHDTGLRSTLQRFVLGTDRRALQVCLLVFTCRHLYSVLEAVLKKAPLFTCVTPIASLGVSLTSVLLVARFKDDIYVLCQRAITSTPWLSRLVSSDVLGLPTSLLPLVIGGPIFGVVWGTAPAVASSVIPLVGQVVAIFPCLGSLHAVFSGDEDDNDVLREWQLYWLLSSTVLPWLKCVLPLPRLASSMTFLILRIFLILDRGHTIPYMQRAVVFLELFVRRFASDSGESRGLSGWDRFIHELHDSWNLAQDFTDQRRNPNRGTRGRLHESAVSASQRVLSTIPEYSPGMSSAIEQENVECVCCCEVTGDSMAICPDGHRTCASCFARLFDMCLNRSLNNLKTDEQQQARYMVECTGGCSKNFGVKTMTSMLTEEQAVRWEQINKRLYKDLNLEEWIRENAAKDAEQKRADEIRASFRAADGTYQNVYQCPQCGYGPKPLTACDNLETHHGEEVTNPRTGQVYRRNNACEDCGWFGRHINMWVPWDGTVRPLASTPGSACVGPMPSVPPSPPEEQLLAMGYSIELIRQEQVARAIRNAQRDGGTLEVAVVAGVNALVGVTS